MRSQSGFTLIELMVVVAVLGIIAAIALPSYTEFVQQGRRGEASGAVGEYQMALERWRAENPTYAATCPAGLTCSGTHPSADPKMPTTVYYAITVNGAVNSYTITAAPTGKQAGDRCGNLVATNSGKPTWSPGGAGCN